MELYIIKKYTDLTAVDPNSVRLLFTEWDFEKINNPPVIHH